MGGSSGFGTPGLNPYLQQPQQGGMLGGGFAPLVVGLLGEAVTGGEGGFASGLLGGLQARQQMGQRNMRDALLWEQMMDRREDRAWRREDRQAELEQARRQQQAQAAALQRRQAALGGVEGMTPEMQAVYANNPALFEAWAKNAMEGSDLPAAAQTAQWFMSATPEEQEAFLATKRAGAARTDVSVNTAPEFETKAGKLLNDLVRAQSLPPSPERDQAIEALQREQAALGIGAEQKRTDTRMSAVANIADRFNTVADANEDKTGPIGGRKTRATVALGVGGEAEGDLTSMEAQMRSLLGTALSGAAIPESEWPTYQAQIPQATDSPAVRRAKTERFKEMMNTLENITNQRPTMAPIRPSGAPQAAPTQGAPPRRRVQWGAQ